MKCLHCPVIVLFAAPPLAGVTVLAVTAPVALGPAFAIGLGALVCGSVCGTSVELWWLNSSAPEALTPLPKSFQRSMPVQDN